MPLGRARISHAALLPGGRRRAPRIVAFVVASRLSRTVAKLSPCGSALNRSETVNSRSPSCVAGAPENVARSAAAAMLPVDGHAALSTVSSVPSSSVKDTSTLSLCPTSAAVSVYALPVSPSMVVSVPSATRIQR